MAKQAKTRNTGLFRTSDISSWNFIIFLTLAFMLLVAVVSAVNNTSSNITDTRTKAANECPPVKIPKVCKGEIQSWIDVNGCQVASCVVK